MIRARKRFGQHFLHDPGVISRIVAAIDPKPGQRIVEIGPGLGALSRPLLERCRRLEVIEIDRDVIPDLQRHCAGAGELVVRQGDVLGMDIASLYGDGPPLRLCGNLPYNISTPLLFRLLASRAVIADMHFMLQKEVVERMVARPGGKIYGRLTVMLAAACGAELLFRVGSGAFRPAPAVDSAVVRLVPHAVPPFPLPDTARFARVVGAAFSMRRKMLRNSLQGVVAEEAFGATGIDAGRRPETLEPAEFAKLAAQPAPPATGL
jgi:16S rRNA (adenine1518-N6/adenine1519-N6)-dimethyltransferase